MKAKPNIDQFNPVKNPDAFLEGGAADLASKTEQSQPVAKVRREQKIFRLPIDLINELKRESYEQSMKTGSRVTETELVEQALKAFFKI
jgi:hypothetical protein